MRKLIITLFITITISIFSGLFIFINYQKNIEEVITIDKVKIYFILYGSYNELSKVNNLNLNNYILENENGYYRVYVGCSINYDNALKIKNIYLDKKIDVYIVEKETNENKFINYLKSVDDFNNISNDDILNIENDIINKYNEIFNK